MTSACGNEILNCLTDINQLLLIIDSEDNEFLEIKQGAYDAISRIRAILIADICEDVIRNTLKKCQCTVTQYVPCDGYITIGISYNNKFLGRDFYYDELDDQLDKTQFIINWFLKRRTNL